ncbi:MAG: xylulokinase [Chloroflexota bacterium]|nr:xylulokinase [Chloroflexota bacterium]
MSQLLLGIDIGTYSSKGVLCRPNGEIVAEARTDHDISIPQPGYAEQDADAIWWADFQKLARQLTTETPPGERIASVGVSAIGACVLPVNEQGRPLRPGILYGVDTRATAQIEALEKTFTREALVAFGGSRLTSQAIGPKILWIKENEPDIYQKTAKFLTATSYIIYKLIGRFVIDAHTATEFNPLLDIHKVSWDERFAEPITALDRLPQIGWSDEVAGHITAQAAQATGIPEGTPVNFGAVDALSEAVSVGVIDSGELMIMYGSTAFMIFLIDIPVATNELWLEAGAFKGQYEYSAGLSTSGSATTWFRDQFAQDYLDDQRQGGPNTYARLAQEAAQAPLGANGLLMLPYMSGERTPIFDPKARGVLAGLSLSHTRGEIYRALLEGTAFAIRMNLEAMQQNGAAIQHGVAVGGGSANDLWLQTVSDVSGIPQLIPEKTIGASYGNAFLAGLASGAIEDVRVLKKDWVKIASRVEPNLQNKAVYDDLYAQFKALYLDTKPVIHHLSDLQK